MRSQRSWIWSCRQLERGHGQIDGLTYPYSLLFAIWWSCPCQNASFPPWYNESSEESITLPILPENPMT